MFEQIHADRLLKLADHLDRGQLFHDQFNYWVVSIQNSCGSNGCAMGECPVIWPEHFDYYWTNNSFTEAYPQLRKTGDIGSTAMEQFFSISETEAKYLFFGKGWSCSSNPTKEEVAAHIRSFVASKGFKVTNARLAVEQEEMVGV